MGGGLAAQLRLAAAGERSHSHNEQHHERRARSKIRPTPRRARDSALRSIATSSSGSFPAARLDAQLTPSRFRKPPSEVFPATEAPKTRFEFGPRAIGVLTTITALESSSWPSSLRLTAHSQNTTRS